MAVWLCGKEPLSNYASEIWKQNEIPLISKVTKCCGRGGLAVLLNLIYFNKEHLNPCSDSRVDN